MKEDEKHSFDKLKREMDYRFAKLEASVAALLTSGVGSPDGVQCGDERSEIHPNGGREQSDHLPVECEGMETEGGGA